MLQAAPPPLRTWTWTSFSTKLLWRVGAAIPPLPERSAGSSQRRPPLAAQLLPLTCATAWAATKLTRISGAHELPVQAAWAFRQPGESHSTVAGTASRG